MRRRARLGNPATALVILASLLWGGSAIAEVDVYREVFPGDRAAGMAGAYTALSDDASGAYYNPAGLTAIEQGDVSLSANAVRFYNETYKNFIFGQEMKAHSIKFFPTNFGAIKRWGPMRFGLSIVVTDELNFQAKQDFNDVLLTGPTVTEPIPVNARFDIDQSSETYLFGPTVAFPVTSKFSVGATVYYVYGQMRENRFLLFECIPKGQGSSEICGEAGDTPSVIVSEHVSRNGTRTGFIGQLGFLWKPIDRLNLGLTIRSKADIHNEVKIRDTSYSVYEFTPIGSLLTIDEGRGQEVEQDFTEDWPWSGTLGVAGKPVDWLTLALDVDYHLSASYPAAGNPVTREAVVNYSLGAEAYVTQSTPLWLGFFTNFSSRPDPVAGQPGQRERVDYLGFTAGGAYEGEHSELAAGVRCAFGDGEALMAEDPRVVIDIDATDISFFIASRYKF